MKNIKRITSLLCCLALIFSVAACAGAPAAAEVKAAPAAEPTEAAATTEAAGATSPAISGTYKWIIATSVGEDTVNGLIITKFKELIEAASNGAITVELYQAGAMGGDKEIMAGLTTGSVDFVCVTTSNLCLVCPEAAVFDIPYLYDNIETARKVLPEFLPEFNPYAEASGVHILGFSDLGLRIMTSNKEVKTISDFSGLKVRTMENKNMMQFISLLGGSATPTDFGEVYLALQQGTVDAQSNAVELTVNSKFFEPQKYLLMTNHEAHIINFLISNDLYASLPDDVKSLVDDCSAKAVAYGNEQTAQRYTERLATLADNLTVINYDEATLAQFKAAAQPEADSIRADVGNQLVDDLLALIEKAK